MLDDIRAAVELIEQRHPGSGWSFTKIIVPHRKPCGVQIFHPTRIHTTFEEADTFLEAAIRGCDRLDRRVQGDPGA